MRSDEAVLQVFLSAFAIDQTLADVILPLATIGRVIDIAGFDPVEVWLSVNAAMVGEGEPINRFVDVKLHPIEGGSQSEKALIRLQRVAEAFGALA